MGWQYKDLLNVNKKKNIDKGMCLGKRVIFNITCAMDIPIIDWHNL